MYEGISIRILKEMVTALFFQLFIIFFFLSDSLFQNYVIISKRGSVSLYETHEYEECLYFLHIFSIHQGKKKQKNKTCQMVLRIHS